MSKYGDNERYTPPVYASGSSIRKKNTSKNSGKADDTKDSDTDSSKDSKSDGNTDTETSDDTSNDEADTDSSEESETENAECEFKTWLEVLPSKGGLLLAAVLVEIMTDGLTPNQMNILGNFVASVGTLISYKASRDDLDVANP